MPKEWPLQIADAKRKGTLMRFESRFDRASVSGYVHEIGPEFFLLAVVSDRIRFDGFECFRLKDVRDLRPDPHGAFVESALKIRGERIPKQPHISVVSIAELLLTAEREFPLVTVHREEVDPEVCWIGRVLKVERGRVSLLEITPDAQWEEKPEVYQLSQITRVGFGADYETALHLVGGGPTRLPSAR